MIDNKRIIILTGEVRSGKTLLVSRIISEVVNNNVKVTGVYSPARFDNEIKTGIYLVDISSGKKRLLANYQPGWDAENPMREWKMISEALKWGQAIIQDAVPTYLLIIDELGFLEFEKDQGWTSAFGVLEYGEYKFALVVVRKGLLNQALAKWKSAEVVYVDKPSQCKILADYLVSQILPTKAK